MVVQGKRTGGLWSNGWLIGGAVLWAALMWMGLVQVGPHWLVRRAPTVDGSWHKLFHGATVEWIVIAATVAWGFNAWGQRFWAGRLSIAQLVAYGQDMGIQVRALRDGTLQRRPPRFVQRVLVGPIAEEFVARWIPLFCFTPVAAVVLVIIGGAAWCGAHYFQVRRRTLGTRLRVLSASAFLYLMTMVAVYAGTHNTIAALIASALAHSVHNLLLGTWPRYLRWVTRLGLPTPRSAA